MGATRQTRVAATTRAGAGSVVLLRQISLFRHLTDDQLTRLAATLTRHTFRRRGPVVRAGDEPDRLYIVAAGRLKVEIRDGAGPEAILGFLGPGEVFGEMSVIDGAPRSATVMALGPCEIFGLDRAIFKRLMQEDFALCLGVVHRLIERVRRADRRIGGFVSLDVRGRVAAALLDIAVTRHGRQVVERVSRQDIAKMIGASREMVSRMMKELEASGAIERRGSTIVLREALAAVPARSGAGSSPAARLHTAA
jgi:CRP/FNR family cyclic AMP-dependent transcriptional regulator